MRPHLRTVGRLGCLAMLLAAASCGESVDPLIERLATAPLPDGAVEVARENRDGDFERGPEASVEYTLPVPLVEACPGALDRYLAADYTLTEFVDERDPITDPTSWCAAELQEDTADGLPQTNIVALAYPPDSEARYPSDGIYVTVSTRGNDPAAGSSILRLSAG